MQAESLAITRTLLHVCSGIVFAKACTGQPARRPDPTRMRSPFAGREGGSQSNGELYRQELTVRSFFSGFRKFQCVEFWSLMRSHRFMGKLTADLSPRYQATEGSAIKLQHHSLSGD